MNKETLSADDGKFLIERRLQRERDARKQAERLLSEKSIELYEALKKSKEIQKSLELALWASQESYWEWRAKDDLLIIRSFHLEKKHETSWEGYPSRLMDLVHSDDVASVENQWNSLICGEKESIEAVFRFKNSGRFQWMRMRGRVLKFDPHGKPLYVVGTNKDITRQRAAEESFQLMASAFSSSREPMLVLSDELVISECNHAFLSLVNNQTRTTIIGRNLLSIVKAEGIKTELISGHPIHCECDLVAFVDTHLPIELSVSKFTNHQQKNDYYIATLRDISERKQTEATLKEMALHDGLTGLFNRNGLRDKMSFLVAKKQPFVIGFIDLDGFKQINDSAGHEMGDYCLKRVAELMESTFSSIAINTRWGGDEFVVVLPSSSISECFCTFSQLISSIESEPLRGTSGDLTLSASIGLASYPDHGESVESLIQKSDAAMYQAKTTGKGKVSEYMHGLAARIKEKVSMLSDLKRAVSSHSLEFYIQGKFDAYGRLHGGELLCRWRSPIHGVIPPSRFIPLAEANDLVCEIGFQALDAACDYVNMFMSAGEATSMAINISAQQLLEPGFVQQAIDICEMNDVDPSYIDIEITESIFIGNEKHALDTLSLLKAAGFKITLDDFGTGYSSLSYLRKFGFEVVKLDRSLIKDISHDARAMALVQGIAAMLNSLELKVVAEGIERADYIPLLQEANINLFQGFYFDNPSPYEQFIAKHTRKLDAAV